MNEKEHLKIFKILDLDTQEKRDRYLKMGNPENIERETQECTFVRTGHSTEILGDTQNAELESDS